MLGPTKNSLDSVHTAIHNVMPHGLRVHFYSDNSFVQQAKPIFTTIGGIAVAYLSAKFIFCSAKALTSYFLAAPLKLGADLRKSGEWAGW